jgi:hypothetical protein
MDLSQWNLVLYSLLSGILGALLLFLFETRCAYQKTTLATVNLITVFAGDLKLLLGLFESGRELDSGRIFIGLWRDLALFAVELFPPDLVVDIAIAYREVELYTLLNPILQRDLKIIACLKKALNKIEVFKCSRSQSILISGFHIHHKKALPPDQK